jgi:hypothetical protein
VSDPSSTTEERFAKIVDELLGISDVTFGSSGKKRFGSSGLKINNKIFAMLSSKGRYVVKLPRERVDALIASGGGERFDPGHGRLMKEWLTVESTAEEEWLALAKEAMEFVASQR